VYENLVPWYSTFLAWREAFCVVQMVFPFSTIPRVLDWDSVPDRLDGRREGFFPLTGGGVTLEPVWGEKHGLVRLLKVRILFMYMYSKYIKTHFATAHVSHASVRGEPGQDWAPESAVYRFLVERAFLCTTEMNHADR